MRVPRETSDTSGRFKRPGLRLVAAVVQHAGEQVELSPAGTSRRSRPDHPLAEVDNGRVDLGPVELPTVEPRHGFT